jgi:thioredoxin-like negative regulator of GroEL
LQRALEAGQPTLAFFHSLNCIPCKEMTAIVNEVYPEFAASVTLVDVDVYDQRNARLLQTAHIRTIPTLIFFDRAGQGQVHMGVLEAGQLRQTLTTLGGGH